MNIIMIQFSRAFLCVSGCHTMSRAILRAPAVCDSLHESRNINGTGKDISEEEEQANTASKLRAQCSAYHIYQTAVKEV